MKNVLNKINLLFISTIMVNGCNETNTNNNEEAIEPPLSEWQLVWSDEFDNDVLDEEKWNIMLWRPGQVNNELQAYTAEENNIFIENGNTSSFIIIHVLLSIYLFNLFVVLLSSQLNIYFVVVHCKKSI